MTIVKHNFKTINDLFDDFFGQLPEVTVKQNGWKTPPVNIHETNEVFHLELLAPGLKKEDFKIGLDKGLLTISFEKKAEAEKKDTYKTLRREFSFAGFKRSFSVDDKIDVDGIQAKYENGVLNLLLPKKEEVKALPKEINIQ